MLKRLALAGLLAASVAGAGFEPAQALPAAPLPARPAADAGIAAAQDAAYVVRRRRRAGLYQCGPRQLHTHLQRKACR